MSWSDACCIMKRENVSDWMHGGVSNLEADRMTYRTNKKANSGWKKLQRQTAGWGEL